MPPGCIVVGHSSGSVPSADVFSRAFSPGGGPFHVGDHVTLGSPLNLPGLRLPRRRAFRFTWDNDHYAGDPVCCSDAPDAERFPGVVNHERGRDEGHGVAHTHDWASKTVARTVRRLSRDT